MDANERDQLIARLLSEGNSLSEVQKLLETEHDLRITYMELRLIAAGLEVNWEKLDADKVRKQKVPADDLLQPETPTSPATIVNVSKVVRPGAVFSGDATFKSGAKAEWWVDTTGRLGLNPAQSSEKPTEEDLEEFQLELQEQLRGKI